MYGGKIVIFINEEHKLFYEGKINQIGKYDVYYKSLIYTLSICSETRKHFKEIFNAENGEIKVECLNSAWQTSTSLKVCRLAFNLFNGFKYDSDEDIETHTVSKYYNVDEIFCCVYAPYFYEAIKIRYPEYTDEIRYMVKRKMNETEVKRFIDMFNKDFKCRIQSDNFSFLIDLFENYINQEISDPSNEMVYENLEVLDEKIKQKLDEEGKKFFKEWEKIQDEYLLNIAEQAFIYGYCVCKALDNETKIGGDENE